jgi:hypothetical protein
MACPWRTFPTPVWGRRAAESRRAAVSGRRAIALAIAAELPFLINEACHGVHFYFPRAALNLIADNGKAPPNRGTAVANQVSGLMMGHAYFGRLSVCHEFDILGI